MSKPKQSTKENQAEETYFFPHGVDGNGESVSILATSHEDAVEKLKALQDVPVNNENDEQPAESAGEEDKE